MAAEVGKSVQRGSAGLTGAYFVPFLISRAPRFVYASLEEVRMRVRQIGLALLAAVMLIGSQSAVWAECGTCQVCIEKTTLTIPRDTCGVANNQDGYMCCSPETYGVATYCHMDGAACYGTTVGGGGGGGGTGGSGGSCRSTGGFCPAECFSCGGGGTY